AILYSPPLFHMDSMWNGNIPWIPLHSMWSPYGICLASSWNPHGIHVESIWNGYIPWNLCGIHMEYISTH
ncbi:hypothetical protein BYT27DRAFT_7192493, partial [Phlegmacium glaucopus]